MLELNALRLTKYVLYQDATFKFTPGITLVGGGNRAGKSLLFAPLKPIICGVSKDDALAEASAVRLLAHKITADGAVKIDVSANTPSRSTRWVVRQNSIDTKEHKQKVIRQRIDTLFGLTPSLFDSTIRLYNKNPAPLTYGQPAHRLEWLSDLFSLSEIYNDLLKRVKAIESQSSTAASELAFYRKELAELGESPVEEADNIDRLQGLLTKINNRISTLKDADANNETTKIHNKLRLLRERKTDYTSVQAVRQQLADLQPKLETANDIHSRNKEREAAYIEWEEAVDRLVASIVKESRLDGNRLTDLDYVLKSKDKCLTAVDKYEEQVTQGKAQQRLYDEYIQDKNNLKDLVPSKKLKEPAKYAGLSIAELKEFKSNAELDLRAISMHEGVTDCPKCGYRIDNQEQAHILQRNLLYYTKQLTWREYRRAAKKFAGKWAIPPEQFDLDELNEKIDTGQLLASRLSKLVDLLKSRPKKPTKASQDYAEHIKSMRRDVDKLKHDLDLFYSCNIRHVPEQTEQQLLDDLRNINAASPAELEKLYEKRSTLRERIALAKMQKANYDKWLARRDELRTKILAVRDAAKEHAAAKVLVDAFGREGMRLLALNESLAVLNAEINRLSPMLFDEPITFEIIAAPRRVDVQVMRNGREGSLLTLSSSETKCWSLLFAVALIKLLPHNLRCDTIILDEMEAHMDAASRQRFAKEFLPYLATVIPKVVVVTPLINGELSLTPDAVVSVVKTNNTTTLTYKG